MNTLSEQAALVLLIDDDALMRLQLKIVLEREGYRIIEAKNGREGLDAYARLRPDIVLLDALMPGLDGFECCQKLNEFSESRHTPVLMITGLNDESSVDRAFEVGAADYVTKPVHWAVLRQRVRRLLQQFQLQQQLEAANLELQRLVSVDGLTQVANRRRFDEYLKQEWMRLQREQQPIALMLCDIDYFKAYNDTYGHLAGDRCLQQVAQAIQNTLKRPADLAARYGGEEFAVIMPNTDFAGLKHMAQLAHAALDRLAIPHARSLVSQQVTISAGAVSLVPQPHRTIETLIAAADAALYNAKREGRSRCCFYPAEAGSIRSIA